MSEFRHVRSGSLNIPPTAGAMASVSGAAQRFDGPRSPPSKCTPPRVLVGSSPAPSSCNVLLRRTGRMRRGALGFQSRLDR